MYVLDICMDLRVCCSNDVSIIEYSEYVVIRLAKE